MINECKISIIVPIYNIEEYLEKCISSIIKQTYTNLQIILVDDGSTDNSGKICDEYAMIDSRIQVIHKENQGLVVARKSGLRCADGRYIGFVDGDDYIDSCMYEQLVQFMEKNDVDFVHSGYYKNDSKVVMGPDNECVIELENNNLQSVFDQKVFDTTNLDFISPSIWSKLFKRELITEAYNKVPDNQSYGEDLISLCECILLSKRIGILDRAFYHYRIRGGSLSHSGSYKGIIQEIKLYESLLQLLDNKVKVETFLNRKLVNGILGQMELLTDSNFPIYKFPNLSIFTGKKIVIFGAGKVGKDYYDQISKTNNCEIVAWIDNYCGANSGDYMKIDRVETLEKTEFDFVLIASLNKRIADSIINQLDKYNVDRKKIVWKAPENIY